MYGYVFLAKNLVTGERWTGVNRAVTFDKHFLGDSDKVIDDVNRYGITKFEVSMLAPAESEETLNVLADKYAKQFPVEPTEKPAKKTRKKKQDDEPVEAVESEESEE